MIDTVTEKPPQDPPLDQAPTVSDEPTEKSGSVRTLLSTIGILLLAPLIAIFLTLFVFQSYQVDGPSMETTLQNNDRLIVWKLPRTWARITGHQYVPSRGDIIILNESGLTSYGSPEDKRQLVKRVVALPGERVVIKDNVLTVYNRENPDGFQPDATLPYGKNGSIPPTTNNAEFTLSATELFVCGDNRPNSLDSRTFGPIQTSQVVGKLVARILPLSNIEKF
jgi:signal peptidase I